MSPVAEALAWVAFTVYAAGLTLYPLYWTRTHRRRHGCGCYSTGFFVVRDPACPTYRRRKR